MTTESVYLFFAVACVLVMAVSAFEVVRSLLTDDDTPTDAELDRLPNDLLHGPEKLPDWVKVEGGDKTLYPFSGGKVDES